MQCDPLQLSIDLIPPDEGLPVCKILRLSNSSAHRVAFKISTNLVHEQLASSPNGGVIEPSCEVDVMIQICPLTDGQYAEYYQNSEAMARHDKIRVRSTQADEDTQDTEVHGTGTQEWWQGRPASEILDQDITCRFVRRSERVEVAEKQLRLMPQGQLARTVGPNEVLAEEIVHVINNTSTRQAFKILTTAKDRYRVERSSGIVDKGFFVSVRVLMVLPYTGTPDRFQVRCVAVDAETDDAAVRESAWWGTEGVRSKAYQMTLDSMLLQPARSVVLAGQDLLDVPVRSPAPQRWWFQDFSLVRSAGVSP